MVIGKFFFMNEGVPESITFPCHKNLFKFNVMPYGLTSAPAVFKELIAVSLKEFASFVTTYLD